MSENSIIFSRNGWVNMNTKMYILEIQNQILAISEYETDIKRYIQQFKTYFENTNYIIKTEIEKSDEYLSKYMGRYLYEFTNSIILTDDEILYYRKIYFDEMYYEFKDNLNRIIYDPKLLEMKLDERKKIMKQNQEYLATVNTFDQFINKFDPQVLLRKYILEPILTFQL